MTTIEIIMKHKNITEKEVARKCNVLVETVRNWLKGGVTKIQHKYRLMDALGIPTINNNICSLFGKAIWNDAKINIDGGRSHFEFRRALLELLDIPIVKERDYLECEKPEVKEEESYVIKDIFGTKVLSKYEVITTINFSMFSEVNKPEEKEENEKSIRAKIIEKINVNINDIYIVRVTKGDNYGLKSSKLIDCKLETILRLLDDPNVVFLLPFIEHYAEKE